jgi:hypothetical protein
MGDARAPPETVLTVRKIVVRSRRGNRTRGIIVNKLICLIAVCAAGGAFFAAQHFLRNSSASAPLADSDLSLSVVSGDAKPAEVKPVAATGRATAPANASAKARRKNWPPQDLSRNDARTGMLLHDIRLRVTRVQIGKNFQSPFQLERTAYPILKVSLWFECINPARDNTRIRYEPKVAKASQVFAYFGNGSGTRLDGWHWGFCPILHLRQSSPVSDTAYFEPPQWRVLALDLDYAAPFLPKGEKYRLRIPGEMVEWVSDPPPKRDDDDD